MPSGGPLEQCRRVLAHLDAFPCTCPLLAEVPGAEPIGIPLTLTPENVEADDASSARARACCKCNCICSCKLQVLGCPFGSGKWHGLLAGCPSRGPVPSLAELLRLRGGEHALSRVVLSSLFVHGRLQDSRHLQCPPGARSSAEGRRHHGQSLLGQQGGHFINTLHCCDHHGECFRCACIQRYGMICACNILRLRRSISWRWRALS